MTLHDAYFLTRVIGLARETYNLLDDILPLLQGFT